MGNKLCSRLLGLLLACALCAPAISAPAEELLQITGYDCSAGEHPPVGEPITWTITTTGGTGEKEYAFYVYWGPDVYSETYTGTFLFASRDFGSRRSFTFTPDREGVYYVHGHARDAAGTLRVIISRNAVFPAPRVISVSARRDIGTTGEEIRWSATFEGGTGYERLTQFVVQRDGEYVMSSEAEASPLGEGACSFRYIPDEPGEYRVTFWLNAHTELDSMLSDPVSVAAPLECASLEPDRYRVLPGDSVTWTAMVSGGHDPQCRFWLYHDGVYLREWEEGPATSFSAVLEEEGAYTALCVVTDALDTVPISAQDVHAGYYMQMPAAILGIFPSRKRAVPGAEITWRVVAMGGSGDRTFDYTLLKDSETLLTLEGQTDSTFTGILEEEGVYRLRVRLADGSAAEQEGGEVEVSALFWGLLERPAALRFRPPQTAAETTRPAKTPTPRPTVTRTPRVTDSPPPPTQTPIKATPTPRPTKTPTPRPTVTRTPRVTDSPPPPTLVPIITIIPFGFPLTVTAKADITYGEVRRPFSVKAAASGGTQKYEYAFRVYHDGVALGSATSYSASSVFSYTPQKRGNYKVLVLVRDGKTKASAYTGNIYIK